MFTLRLIFYGLVALVPSINNEGAMVLFPSAAGLKDAEGNDIPTHRPRIFLVTDQANGEPLLDELAALKGVTYMEPNSFLVLGVTPVTGIRIGESGAELSLPSNPRQLGDSTWIPRIDHLSADSANVRSECLVDPSQCGIKLVFRTWQGAIRTCHLAHPRVDDENCGDKVGPITTYRFKALGGTSTSTDMIQAVGDAFIVEIEDIPQAPLPRSIYVQPSLAGGKAEWPIPFSQQSPTVTLLFANLPDNCESPCSEAGIDRHFDTYYHLGSYEPHLLRSRPVPHHVQDDAPIALVRSLECEPEIKALERFARASATASGDGSICPKVKPHSIEVCATATYSPTNLPSTRSDPRITAASIQKANAAAVGAQPLAPPPQSDLPDRRRPPAQRPPVP